MHTEIINSNQKELILKISKSLLESGEILAFPTETVYGLGCDIFNLKAIEKIFIAKSRQNTNPLAAHIGNLNQIEGLWREIPDDFYKLAERFLPGPLSIIYNKSESVSDAGTSGMNTLSIRYPDNEICRDIVNNFGRAIAATSANLSGRPSPVNAENVIEDLDGIIPLIVDDGNVIYGMESTVLSIVDNAPIIFREGIISAEEIEEVLGKKVINKDNSAKKQYAPKAKIFEFNSEKDLYIFIEKNFLSKFVILSDYNLKEYSFDSLKAETLFDDFRKADKNKAEALLILYNVNKENRLIKEKVKRAVNQQL